MLACQIVAIGLCPQTTHAAYVGGSLVLVALETRSAKRIQDLGNWQPQPTSPTAYQVWS